MLVHSLSLRFSAVLAGATVNSKQRRKRRRHPSNSPAVFTRNLFVGPVYEIAGDATISPDGVVTPHNKADGEPFKLDGQAVYVRGTLHLPVATGEPRCHCGKPGAYFCDEHTPF